METTADIHTAAGLAKLKKPELQKLAQERGIRGTSRMRKADIVDALLGNKPKADEKSVDQPSSGASEAPEKREDRRGERPKDGGKGQPESAGKEQSASDAVAEELQQTRAGRQNRGRGNAGDGRQSGQRPDGQRSDGQRSDGQRSGGQRSDGQRSGGQKKGEGPSSVDEIALPEGSEQGRGRSRRDRGSRRRGRNQQGRRQNQNQNQGQNQGPNQGQNQRDEEPPADDSSLVPIAGIVDVQSNHAFVRTSGYLPGPNDVYVTLGNVRRWGLRPGDAVAGFVRPQREGERRQQKYNALIKVDSINGMSVEDAKKRREFAKLTPEYPREQLRMETSAKALTPRMIDLVSPIGKGQRGLIVSPPKAGKTMIIQQIAKAIEINNPNVHLMVVLVDERPEEVTDMRSIVNGEVIASTFDRPASDHTIVAELAIERAKRLVEMNQDVVILLDSITRLSRAYNLAAPASGRILSGGVDAGALYPPKKFFGSARSLREGGSLTIIASALVETGSKMDEVIFEEFKGTGNMELRLSRALADRRIFPAIDINASGTRREELLFKPEELQILWKLRRALGSLDQQPALESTLARLKDTQSNAEFLMSVARSAD